MKNQFLTIGGIFCATLFIGCKDQYFSDPSNLPTKVMDYIETHFPEEEILSIEREREFLLNNYEVALTNRISLEFDGKNDVRKIESNSPLPNSVIHPSIRAYVESNYANYRIISWEEENRKQYVELNNDKQIIFNRNNEFLGIEND
jgi:hypothetical protein